MKLINRLVVLCTIALSVVSLVVIGIRQITPQSKLLPELQRCTNNICLLGIVPNKTTFIEARKIIDDMQAFPAHLFMSTVKQSWPFYQLQLFAPTKPCSENITDCVGEIDLLFPNQVTLMAGQIIGDLGPPCGIIPQFMYKENIIMYPGMMLFFTSNDPSDVGRFQPESRLQQINFFMNSEPCGHPFANTEISPWRGFTLY